MRGSRWWARTPGHPGPSRGAGNEKGSSMFIGIGTIVLIIIIVLIVLALRR